MTHFNNDQRNLEELLEEGWFDRFKARGAEALGSAKGLGQQIKGGFQQAAGSALTMVDKEKGKQLSQRGQSNRGEGKVSGHNAKVQYLQKNIDKRIQSFVDDIKNDIKKLGLDIGNIEIVSGINDALNLLKKSVIATPPPLPRSNATSSRKQMDDDDDEPENPIEYSYKRATSRQKKSTTNPRKSRVRSGGYPSVAEYNAKRRIGESYSASELDDYFWK